MIRLKQRKRRRVKQSERIGARAGRSGDSDGIVAGNQVQRRIHATCIARTEIGSAELGTSRSGQIPGKSSRLGNRLRIEYEQAVLGQREPINLTASWGVNRIADQISDGH